MFASCSNTLRVDSWPIEVLKENSEYIPQSDEKISHLSWCNDNSYMAILQQGEKPQILSIKDLSNIRTVHTINDHNISSVVFKKGTKKHLAMGTKNGDVMIYDTKLRSISRKFVKLTSPIEFLEFSYDDLQLAALCEDKTVVFYTEADGKVNNEYKHGAKCSCIKFHPSALNKMAVGCANGYVTIWDTKTNSKMYNCQLHSQAVSGISLARSGNFLISVGKDHKVCVTDLNSGECQFRINLNVPVNTVDLRFDDKIIGVGLDDGSVYLYDMNFAVQPLSCLRQHNSPVNIISFANFSRDYIETESSISTVTSIQDHISEMRMTSPKTGLTNNSDPLKNVKRDFLQTVKNQTDELEGQLVEHCKKFQVFINNEFKMINDIMQDKWELFGASDVNKLLQSAESDFCDAEKI
ncbi:katanin p80 WD40 repeat-containing subunit B1-like [Harmonia axyridis]|uniref:katanin p80 WD40 repeat-containing subunit B1-like n=1 Tax=Harmonia axyridis TaxID=115357 RepID=UPI001E275E46|nr:katanin p80 WD40 repeat-containing subunit B1-like [Harmonia axyridis]